MIYYILMFWKVIWMCNEQFCISTIVCTKNRYAVFNFVIHVDIYSYFVNIFDSVLSRPYIC